MLEQNNVLDYIAHEVRTSIHGVTSISQFLHENWDKLNDAERRRQIAIIANNNQHITSLTDQLLDLSKFSTGKMKFNYTYTDLLSCIKIIIEQFKELNIIIIKLI
ncbi:MAG: histidine kinase dimerization/phospho-acceptor domain-containing protein [Candidatus Rickettsia vulgarisii]